MIWLRSRISMTIKWYGTANRDNPKTETQRFPLGDEWDSEPVAETA
jgi:hypothetical protein